MGQKAPGKMQQLLWVLKGLPAPPRQKFGGGGGVCTIETLKKGPVPRQGAKKEQGALEAAAQGVLGQSVAGEKAESRPR